MPTLEAAIPSRKLLILVRIMGDSEAPVYNPHVVKISRKSGQEWKTCNEGSIGARDTANGYMWLTLPQMPLSECLQNRNFILDLLEGLGSYSLPSKRFSWWLKKAIHRKRHNLAGGEAGQGAGGEVALVIFLLGFMEKVIFQVAF